jgi:hypothetical protein
MVSQEVRQQIEDASNKFSEGISLVDFVARLSGSCGRFARRCRDFAQCADGRQWR